ncbi:MAG: serine hydroxymethyltransferase [Alphaproteobacteria bacterium]
MRDFFSAPLAETDPPVAAALADELNRQRDSVPVIASENLVSRAVLDAQGSVLTNKTIEGYPGRRYHSGARNADILERLAIDRAKALFGCRYANVQPHSGSQANQAVLLVTVKPGDAILGMALDAGGHLSHGAAANMSGRWFRALGYGVRRDDGLIDYDEAERQSQAHRPKLVIAGGSSYPRVIDFARLRAIADSVGALFLVDMAHFGGLVVGGVHPNSFPHAHIATTTTFKSLRGPRGAVILTDDEALAKRIDAAVFPGMQGSALVAAIAAKAVCFGEALRPEFRTYAQAVLANARTLAAALMRRGYDIVTGGTDTPLLLVDLRRCGLKGNVAAASLERARIDCNMNAVPFDEEKPHVTSGLRFGTAAGTTRGFGTAEFERIGDLAADVLDGLRTGPRDNARVERTVAQAVGALTRGFPIYPG